MSDTTKSEKSAPPIQFAQGHSLLRRTVLASCLAIITGGVLYGLRLHSEERFTPLRDAIESLSFLVVFLGIPAGLWQYVRSTEKEIRDREYATFDALDDKFIEFQRLCLEHPELDIFDIADESPVPKSAEMQKQELIAFTILFAIFERAFIMYSDGSTEAKTRQWNGWDEYVRMYLRRSNVRKAWDASGSTYDLEFEKYMRQQLEAVQPNRVAEQEKMLAGDIKSRGIEVVAATTLGGVTDGPAQPFDTTTATSHAEADESSRKPPMRGR